MTFLARWTRHFLVAAILAAAVAATASGTASARVIDSRTHGVWTYEHFRGDIEWCGVKTNWPNNNMVLTIRLQRNKLDFFFYNRDWNLKRQTKTGATVFAFGNRRFFADSETLDSNKAIFGTFRDRISDFVSRFKRARDMRIEFPTDQTIGVNLRGSSRAMDFAIECWNRNLNY